jgi:hypothetical protein
VTRKINKLFAVLIAILGVSTLHATDDARARMATIGFVPSAWQYKSYCDKPVYKPETSSSGRVFIQTVDATALIGGGSPEPSFAGRAFGYKARNRGEFGGELRVFPPGGKSRRLLSGNVQQLIAVGADLYVFEGLDHFGMSTGAIQVVRAYDSAPKLQLLTLMTDRPIHAIRSERGFLIVGNEALTEFNEEPRTLEVYPYDRMVLRATSGLIESGSLVVIGACGGVIALSVPCSNALMPDANTDRCRARFYIPRGKSSP